MNMQALRAVTPDDPRLTRADQAGQFEPLRGRCVILADAGRVYPGYRAWSDLDVDEAGAWVVVTRERHWWMWELLDVEPRTIRWPAGAVWLYPAAAG
jgi:hypothetical protein